MVRPRFVLSVSLALASLVPAIGVAQRVELLDFYLPTCQPCRAMTPTVDRLAAEGVPIRKVDGSREPALARRLGVDRYPTFVVVVDGREAGRVVGMTSYQGLRGLVARATQAAPAKTQLASAPATFARAATGGGDRSFAVGGDLGPGRPAAPRATGVGAADDRGLLRASVRLTVEDPAGRAYGTGTLVDARDGEALVVTCAHLFRDAAGRPIDTNGRLSVELYDVDATGPRVVERVAGQLVSHDFEADVALVAIRPAGRVAVAPVAGSPGEIAPDAAVRSVGCDLGADPTVRPSRVVSLNRYLGAPNIETTGAPVQGRSGGGLFNAAGQLIGVCFASDEEADEGLYSGLASIHAQLDRVGMSELYRGAAPPPAAIAKVEPPVPVAAAPASASGELAPVVRGQTPPAPSPLTSPPADWFASADAAASPTPRPAAPEPARLAPVERAALEEIVGLGGEAEVVLLIRPKRAGAATEVMTLDSASPAFVAALREMRAETASVGGSPAGTARF